MYVAMDVARHIEKDKRNLLFITTPIEPESEQRDLGWFDDDRNALIDAGFELTDYTFTGHTPEEIKEKLEAFDILFMSGGNAFYFLQQIQQTNCADIIKEQVEEGDLIYIGCSAGSCLAGPNISSIYSIDQPEDAPDIDGYKGLGIVNFTVFPHWGSSVFKEAYEKGMFEHAYSEVNPLIMLSNYQYIIEKDNKLQIVNTALTTN